MNAVRVVAAFVQEIGSLIRQDWLRVKGDIRQEGGVCPTWFRGRTASLPAAEFKSRWFFFCGLVTREPDKAGNHKSQEYFGTTGFTAGNLPESSC